MVSYAEANAYQANPTGDRPDLEIIRAARGLLCRKAVEYTKAFIPTPFDTLYEGIVGQACPTPLLPAPKPPSRPFSGGQCPGVRYRVSGVYDIQHVGSDDAFNLTFSVQDRFGAISAVVIEEGTPQVSNGSGIVLSHRDPSGNAIRTTVASVGGFPNYRIVNLRNVVVTRQDGLADNCGNLPIDYPSTPVPTPPQLTETLPVPIRPGVTINLPVIAILPTIKGELNVDLGGINVKFDLGGITIGGGSDGSLDGILDLIADIQNDIADIKEDGCKERKPPNPIDYDVEEITDDEGGSSDGTGTIKWVAVDMAERPRNGKVQQGGGGDNLFYWGWFSFRCGDRNLPRVPLHYERNIIPAPDGCSGYNYGVYTGYTADITVFREKSND